jgi:hypothetical protein
VGVDFRGSFEFLSLSFTYLVYFNFELFFAIFLDLMFFVSFVGFATFSSCR